MVEKKLFGYPEFDEQGEEILSTYENEYRDMLMDVRVYRMAAGTARSFGRAGEECAVLLLSGKITFAWNDETATVSRKSVFTEGPWTVHGCTGTIIKVTAEEDTEILVQYTKNDAEFAAKLYAPEECPWKWSTVGKLGNVAKRRVNTIFDKDIQPASNMVLGEVLNDKGNWSGYLPHRHPQPELYYFRFDRPEGFGASFVGDDVFKSVDNSFSAIPGGKLHPQSVAPGFTMYTTWMIRHLPGDPWLQTSRFNDAAYEWLWDQEPEYFETKE
ncbi:MAG: 5-deoxy-glucuronate isomerase [Lachnospiraceae bacterium]|nr:5-deoxy-glucuronate isomerase [Lachnospiraceae bacterium]